MALLGLLSNQSSYVEPHNFRTGTLWYNLNRNRFNACQRDYLCNISEFLRATNSESLEEWSRRVHGRLDRIVPRATFSGQAHENTDVINIPDDIQHLFLPTTSLKFYKNGKLVAPHGVSVCFGCPVCLELSGDSVLQSGDSFTVFLSETSEGLILYTGDWRIAIDVDNDIVFVV
jgi:hypothetical protein